MLDWHSCQICYPLEIKILLLLILWGLPKEDERRVCFCQQDQDQDILLVKRRNDNHSPGPVIRELVPNKCKTALSRVLINHRQNEK